MNFKTTFLLIVLAGAGGGAWYWLEMRRPEEKSSATAEFLVTSLKPDKITRIEIARGKDSRVVLEKTADGWYLPGKWPARPQETEQWIETLAALRSRFTPTTLEEGTSLKPYGLDGDPLTVKITAGDEGHTLRFGEAPDESNRFSRPTYLRLGAKPEIVRLGPGVLAALDRPLDYFRQRRLFPYERVLREEDAKEKVEQVVAAEIEIESQRSKFKIAKKRDEWLLKEAYSKKDKEWKRAASEDRLDPAKRDALLRGFPDFWADKFVEDKDKTLKDYGLDEPEHVLTVRGAGKTTMKLLVGKVSDTKIRTGAKPPPNQFGMPPKMPEIIREEYRYAKLADNPQIFEFKSNKLSDVAIDAGDLRDPRLARFKRDDVKRLEIKFGDQTLSFVKYKEKPDDKDSREKWRLDGPAKQDVETSVVEDFVEKLIDLRVDDREMLDDADPKTVGLDKPTGRIQISLEEVDKSAPKAADPKDQKKKPREIVMQLGVKEKEKNKVYARVDHWARINELDGDFLKLVERSELAYRPRELWKFDRDEIKKITIQADGPPYQVERGDKGWTITGTGGSAGETMADFADELARLRVERFEAKATKDAKELAKFGLDKPAFQLTFAGKDGKPRTLEIGGKLEGKDGGRFAKLADGDAVFVLNEKFAANLRKDAFDFLDKTLLSLNPTGIERIRYQGTAPFELELKGNRWQVVKSPAGDFAADDQMLKLAVSPLAGLRADKYVEVGPKIDWAKYGLAPPSLTIVVTARPEEKDKDKLDNLFKDKFDDLFKDKEKEKDKDKEKGKEKNGKDREHTIELGKDAEGGGRYARIDKKDAVVVLDAVTTEQLVRTHLDFLDPRVLRFDGDAVVSIERKMTGGDLELAKREDNWQMIKPGIRDADNLTIFDVLRRASTLKANRIADFPAKDLAKFGLDKPAAVITVHVELDGSPSKHVIKLGSLVTDAKKKETGERFAIIDDQKMVVVLSAELSKSLAAPAFYFADRNLAAFSNADQIEMARGSRKAVFSRGDKGWEMTAPTKAAAESSALDDLLRNVQRLRADEIVAEKAPDLKKFGLDQPAAQFRFKSGGDEKLHLIVGALENDQPGARRYAKLGDKNTIFLLNAKLTARAVGEFRAREPIPPFEFGKATAITITEGAQKPFTLEKKDKEWRVAGDAKPNIKSDAVFETVITVASLRAKHWVADDKTDLKKYGLEPPAWKIEVQIEGGKRELWLGGFEDKSKRYYAMTPGVAGVFVLDESDGAILARPLSAYVEAEKKK